MGHRAEKQAYGSMSAFKRSGDSKPVWVEPKIGFFNKDTGKRVWKPRHIIVTKEKN